MTFPPTPPPVYENIAEDIKQFPQWVTWKWDLREGKLTKVLINVRTGGNAMTSFKPKGKDGKYLKDAQGKDVVDMPRARRTWSEYFLAEKAVKAGRYIGYGFVFDELDPFFGIDLDDCVNPETGEIAEWAMRIVEPLGTYTEISPSGTGIKMIGRGKLPGTRRRQGNIEMYDRGRFFTLTGRTLGNKPVRECQAQLDQVYALVFPAQEKQARASAPSDFSASDEQIIEIIRKSKQGTKFNAYMSGDVYGKQGESEAVHGLCYMLAFYTDDAAQIDRIVRRSGFVTSGNWSGGKWDRLGDTEIERALANVTKEYTPPKPRTVKPGRPPVKAGTRQGDQPEAQDGVPPGTNANGATAPNGRPNYRSSDTGNAERFVDQHGAGLRYDHDAKCWSVWDGQRWNRDGNGRAQERAKETVIGIYAEAAAEPDEDKRKALATHAKASDKAPRITALMALASTDPRVSVTAKVWDQDTHLLNCVNGTLDLRTDKLKPHDPADLITKLCPVEYDPDAPCPLWDRCMQTWQPDPEIRAFLQRAAGCSLTGDIGEETAFFLYGVGRNGKSKFTSALEDIMGDYAARVNIEVLMDSRKAGNATPDLIPLIGARLVIASELPEGRRINEAFLKDITGGDKLTANPKYANIITFRPQFKLWLYGNHMPNIKGTDDGIWSRLPLVPFTVTIPEGERDPELSEKLRHELPGILAWAVRGNREWRQKRLSPPPAVLKATQEFRESQDTLTSFWEQFTVFGQGLWTPNVNMRDAYLKWCETEKNRNPLSPQAFAERLKQKGASAASGRHSGNVVRGWRGVGLKATNDEFTMTPPENVAENADVDSVDGSEPIPINFSHVDTIEKFPKSNRQPSTLSTGTSFSDTGNANTAQKKEEKESKPSSVDGGSEVDAEDPFACAEDPPASVHFSVSDVEQIVSNASLVPLYVAADQAVRDKIMPDDLPEAIALGFGEETRNPRSRWQKELEFVGILRGRQGDGWRETRDGSECRAALDALARWWHTSPLNPANASDGKEAQS